MACPSYDGCPVRRHGTPRHGGLSLDPRCAGSLILGCVFEFAFFPIRQPGQRTSESAVAGALGELGTGSEKGCGRAHEACDGPCATRCEVRDKCMYCIATASRVRLAREACPLAVMEVPAYGANASRVECSRDATSRERSLLSADAGVTGQSEPRSASVDYLGAGVLICAGDYDVSGFNV